MKRGGNGSNTDFVIAQLNKVEEQRRQITKQISHKSSTENLWGEGIHTALPYPLPKQAKKLYWSGSQWFAKCAGKRESCAPVHSFQRGTRRGSFNAPREQANPGEYLRVTSKWENCSESYGAIFQRRPGCFLRQEREESARANNMSSQKQECDTALARGVRHKKKGVIVLAAPTITVESKETKCCLFTKKGLPLNLQYTFFFCDYCSFRLRSLEKRWRNLVNSEKKRKCEGTNRRLHRATVKAQEKNDLGKAYRRV